MTTLTTKVMRWGLAPAFVVATLAAAAATTIGVYPAAATPAGFPDLSGYTDVTQDFASSNGRGETFAPSDGVECGLGMPPLPSQSLGASCWGTLPGLQNIPLDSNTKGDCDLGAIGSNPRGISHYRGPCPAPTGAKVLQPGQKVSYRTITCGVAPGGVTACLDTTDGQEHGFVLDPAGSWTF